jgi:VIT1/CCC1 family predicted Fe2+/Mn2+ transporter
VSVFSQADTEKADLAREHRELTEDPEAEHRELTAIYTRRGIEPPGQYRRIAIDGPRCAGAHARDELGISEALSAKPLQAALAAASFAVGAVLPLGVVMLAPRPSLLSWTVVTAIFFLALLGVLAARIGGASVSKARPG